MAGGGAPVLPVRRIGSDDDDDDAGGATVVATTGGGPMSSSHGSSELVGMVVGCHDLLMD